MDFSFFSYRFGIIPSYQTHIEKKWLDDVVQERKCIIGGLAAGDEIQFLIPFSFHSFYFELTNWSKRIWLFKSTNSWSMITAPIGLYVRYSIYFPE